MAQVTQTYSDVSIGLPDGSSKFLFEGSESLPGPDTFSFLTDVPISNSTDICAYLCAVYSLDYFDYEWEKEIIPPIFLFYRGELSFYEMFNKINSILQENVREYGSAAEIIEALEKFCSDDPDDDLRDDVMDVISDVLGDPLFNEALTEEICIPDPSIPASEIKYIFFYYQDFCQRDYDIYWNVSDFEEFETDSQTPPDSPHFKYLLAKWASYRHECDPRNAEEISNEDKVMALEDALRSGNFENLWPLWWFSAEQETYYINNQIPDKPKAFEFRKGEKIISAEFESQFENLENVTIPESAEIISAHSFEKTKMEKVFIPDGVTEIGDFAFYNNSRLKSVRLPKTLLKIGTKAFDRPKTLFSSMDPELELAIPDNVTEIGYTENPDILRYASEHGIRINIKYIDTYDIYNYLKNALSKNDSELIQSYTATVDIPNEFMEFWHIGIMHDAIEFGTAGQMAALLNSGKLRFTDEELAYLIDYATESGKPEHTACLLNYKNEKTEAQK